MTTDTKLTALQRIHDMAERPTCICGVPTGTAAIKTCAAAALAAEPVPSDSDRLEWTIEDNAKKAIEIADLKRDQRRIALAVIEALAQMCEKNVDHIAENSKALRQWDDCADEARARELGSMYVREFAWLLRSGIINVDEIIGRGK